MNDCFSFCFGGSFTHSLFVLGRFFYIYTPCFALLPSVDRSALYMFGDCC